MSTRRDTRGAALVMAIAIMTILLAIALTFYAVSQTELTTATNITETVRVDLLSDASIAIAMAHLNQDFLIHPGATSNDHAWRTIFDGRWVAGKEWALRNGVSLADGGLPEIDLNALPVLQFADGTSEPLYRGPLSRDWLYIPRAEGDSPVSYAKNILNTNIDIFDLDTSNDYPFVTSTFYGPVVANGPAANTDTLNEFLFNDTRASIPTGLTFPVPRYPKEQVARWADVDNDEDNLNDSMWIPLPGDVFFDLDGVDNDLDGFADIVDALNTTDVDEPNEAGVFVYWGGDDNLDNDNDTLIDEFDVPGAAPDNGVYERVPGFDINNPPLSQANLPGGGANFGFFLTAPLPGELINVDLNGNGLPDDLVRSADTVNCPTGLCPQRILLPDTVNFRFRPRVNGTYVDDGTGDPIEYAIPLTANFVDRIDNDYDLIVNDYFAYAFRQSNPVAAESALANGYANIAVVPAFGNGVEAVPDDGVVAATGEVIDYGDMVDTLYITHSGEPVCDLVGRAAILISDEAAKVNLNVAGGLTYNDVPNTDQGEGRLRRALNSGVTPHEYEPRVLPDIGVARANRMHGLLTGSPEGYILPQASAAQGNGSYLGDGTRTQDTDFRFLNDYHYDISLPGVGRMDDNGNAVLLSMNGRDDDGDGLQDEGIFLPPVGHPLYNAYLARLGSFEGIDEPGELQRFGALRNPTAEQDGFDNDGDDGVVIDEFGELGDRSLQNLRQVSSVLGSGNLFSNISNLTTVFSTARNVNYIETNVGTRGANRIDYNLATPAQIAASFLLQGDYVSVTDERRDFLDNGTEFYYIPNDEARSFVEGLRQGDVHVESPAGGVTHPGGFLHLGTVPATVEELGHRIPADRLIQAMQASVNIVDNRDTDHIRSVLTTERHNIINRPGSEDTFNFSIASDMQLVAPFPKGPTLTDFVPAGELLPLEEIEQQLVETLKKPKNLEALDVWWGEKVFGALYDGDGNVIDDGDGVYNDYPEERRISYTTTGVEAIRINELMVRPVRRVEAEMLNTTGNFDPTPYAGMPEFLFQANAFFPANWLREGSVLGLSSYMDAAGAATVPDFTHGPVPVDVSNVIQFKFKATDLGLPPGRYYLTFNSAGLDGIPTVTGANQVEYAIKYIDDATQPDILEDMAAAYTPNPATLAAFFADWQTVPAAHVSNSAGEMPGMVFIDGTPRPPLGQYYLDGGGTLQAPAGGALATHTVTIDANITLCVAFRMNPLAGPGDTLSINFFDLTQEPDHEWVELVNSGNAVVDLSGWQLEVGIPDRPGVLSDPNRSIWTVPPSTLIAPGGTVLLSFNKFDTYSAPGGTFFLGQQQTLVNNNGMGLTQGFPAGLYDMSEVTVPPIAWPYTLTLPDATTVNDLTGSVFNRAPTQLYDLVDRNGDGIMTTAADSLPFVEGYVDPDDPSIVSGLQSTPNYLAGDTSINPTQPWDRIVEMRCERLFTDNPYTGSEVIVNFNNMTLDQLASFVLRGGVLPNAPEHDDIDNDGDGVYYIYTPDGPDIDLDPDLELVPGPLDYDMVDNNLDDLIDWVGGSVGTSEGIDEGKWSFSTDPTNARFGRRFGYGSYEQDHPESVGNDRGLAYQFITSRALANEMRGAPALLIDGSIAVGTVPTIKSTSNYQGSDLDPPEWKAFAERRWNPGDNVIVTLYQGSTLSGNVVDRVTYRELDVTNRTIDDLVESPYLQSNYHFNPSVAGNDRVTLHPGLTTFWPPDQMGLDFYRSLERKHPLYAGDKFGTINRWQATDGNYDDWAESLSVFQNTVRIDAYPYFLATPADPRFDADPGNPDNRLYGHALLGSPLRMNLAQRLLENPQDATLLNGTQFASADTVADAAPPQAAFTTEAMDRKPWTLARNSLDPALGYRRVVLANEPFRNTGELVRVPHFMFEHRMLRTSFLFDMIHPNLNLRAGPDVSRMDLAQRGALLGQDGSDKFSDGSPLQQALSTLSLDTLTLTVGQANFKPILPDVSGNEDLLTWDDLNAPPGAWTPVFLFANNNEGYQYPSYPDGSVATVPALTNAGDPLISSLFNENFLFHPDNAFHGDMSPGVLSDRWPLANRPIAYISARRQNPSQQFDPPEGLFEWDASDGLENGEYIVYIGTYVPYLAERLATANPVAIAATGEPMLDEGPGPNLLTRNDLRSQQLTVEVITDRTRTQGTQIVGGDTGLVAPGTWDAKTYTPGADGTILYGNSSTGNWQPQMVRVTGNYLAVRIRNAAPFGQTGIFTHVVLAPRKRVAGKININTVENTVVDTSNGEELFNALLGLPGVVDVGSTVIEANGQRRFPFSIHDTAGNTAEGLNPVDPPSLTTPHPSGLWNPPYEFVTLRDDRSVPPTPAFVDGDGLVLNALVEGYSGATRNNRPQDEIGALLLSSLIMYGRTEHPDGRYYETLDELVDSNGYQHPFAPPNTLIYPLSNMNESDSALRFDEAAERFRKMSNNITTRSDVFEIIATVQAGYGVDANGDGRFNYRDNGEFVTTAENKSRVVYERRSSPDRSDEPPQAQ